MLVPIADILAARERIAPHLPPTPVVPAESYTRRCGVRVQLKLELFQPTRAFKVRGALNAVLSLSEDERGRGVIAASAGNHGIGLAYAARLVGARATVVLPQSAAGPRADTVRRLGAEAVVHGEDWNAAHAHALELAAERGQRYVPPFDDPAIIAGQGTLALELLEQVPDLDAVVASVGGGGLVSGIASALRQLRPDAKVYGVETLGADCVAQSLVAGRVVELPRFSSIATSLGTKRTAERPFAIIREAVERVVTVSDEAALRELVRALNDEKLLMEPAASCTLAALVDGHLPELEGKTVAMVVCGASVTLTQVMGWLERFSLDAEGRPLQRAGHGQGP